MAANPQDISTAAEWYVDHGRFLRGRAAKAVGQDADDLYQDLFVKILERGNLHTIEDPVKYLTRTQSNEVIGHWRKPVRVEVPVEDAFVESEAEIEVGAALEMEEGAELLRRCLPMLKRRHRAVLELKLEGKSRDEIAEILELSPHAVTQLTKRAHDKLERTLLQEGYVRSLLPWGTVGWLRDKVRALGTLLNQNPAAIDGLLLAAVIATSSLLPVHLPASDAPGILPLAGGTAVTRMPSPESSTPPQLTSVPQTQAPPTTSAASGGNRRTTLLLNTGHTKGGIDEREAEGTELPLDQQLQNLANNPSKALPSCPQTVACPWGNK